ASDQTETRQERGTSGPSADQLCQEPGWHGKLSAWPIRILREDQSRGAGRARAVMSAHQPLSIFHDEPAVGRDPALGTGIDNQVPMQSRRIDGASFRIALAERDVRRAADLLVVEDAAGKTIDAAIEPQAQLADSTGTGVEVEHCLEIVLA